MPSPLRAFHLFPRFTHAEAIEAVRRVHDPLAHKIPAHITLVFPFRSDLPDRALRRLMEQVAADVPAFDVALDPRPQGTAEIAWLPVTEGAESVRDLHAVLYGGELAPFLDAARPFVPHVTIGRFDAGHPRPDPWPFAPPTPPSARVDELVLEEIRNDESSRVIATVKLASVRI